MADSGAEPAAAEADQGAEQNSTRERILDIAQELFTELGYEKTSLRQIAERLGMGEPASRPSK